MTGQIVPFLNEVVTSPWYNRIQERAETADGDASRAECPNVSVGRT